MRRFAFMIENHRRRCFMKLHLSTKPNEQRKDGSRNIGQHLYPNYGRFEIRLESEMWCTCGLWQILVLPLHFYICTLQGSAIDTESNVSNETGKEEHGTRKPPCNYNLASRPKMQKIKPKKKKNYVLFTKIRISLCCQKALSVENTMGI